MHVQGDSSATENLDIGSALYEHSSILLLQPAEEDNVINLIYHRNSGT